MIKTLKITSIIAAALAVVIVFIVFPAVFGAKGNRQIEQFLKSPSVVEKFESTKTSKAGDAKDQTSPLLTQARAFALYLNPPPKPTPSKTVTSRKPTDRTRRPATVSSKFKLIGTSFFPSQPEMSLALIDEPGKGFRWVRQSGKVGHLIIEQVKDGLVVVRDGKRTFDLPVVERPKKPSLIKGGTSRKTSSSSVLPADRTDADIADKILSQTTDEKEGVESTPEVKDVVAIRPRPVSDGDAAMLEELFEILRNIDQNAESTENFQEHSGESEALLEEFFSGLKAVRVSKEEAQNLEDLGKELQSSQQDPNQTKGRKVEIPKRSSRPRRTRKSSEK